MEGFSIASHIYSLLANYDYPIYAYQRVSMYTELLAA